MKMTRKARFFAVLALSLPLAARGQDHYDPRGELEERVSALEGLWDGLRAGAGGPLSFRPVQEPAGMDRGALHKTVELLSSDELEGRAPLTRGSELSRVYFIARMKEYGLAPAGEEGGYTQAVRKSLFRNVIGVNVVGALKGRRKPDECVYVEAHYDHWGRAGGKIQPGANDNASGVAVMLELARLLARMGADRTVVFLASDFEEGAIFPMAGGLKGAAYQVGHPFCAQDKIMGALVMDMVGGSFIPGVPPHLYLIGSESSQATYALAKSLARDKESAVPLRQLGVYAIEPAGRAFPRADYGPFRESGVPFIFATSGIPAEYHTEKDTIDKVDFAFMQKAGAEILKIVERMASADFHPSAAANPEEVIDWDAELWTLEDLVDSVLEGRGLPYEKLTYVVRLKMDRDRLRAELDRGPSESRKRKLIKEAAAEAVMTVMRMNGSWKLWDHIHREP